MGERIVREEIERLVVRKERLRDQMTERRIGLENERQVEKEESEKRLKDWLVEGESDKSLRG
jgi:hypothetical protein